MNNLSSNKEYEPRDNFIHAMESKGYVVAGRKYYSIDKTTKLGRLSKLFGLKMSFNDITETFVFFTSPNNRAGAGLTNLLLNRVTQHFTKPALIEISPESKLIWLYASKLKDFENAKSFWYEKMVPALNGVGIFQFETKPEVIAKAKAALKEANPGFDFDQWKKIEESKDNLIVSLKENGVTEEQLIKVNSWQDLCSLAYRHGSDQSKKLASHLINNVNAKTDNDITTIPQKSSPVEANNSPYIFYYAPESANDDLE